MTIKQSRLDSFFKVISKNKTDKKLFIYDGKKAFFTNETAEDDKFISNQAGLKLYYRGVVDKPMVYPKLENGLNYAPLIKSHLQKAIRLGNTLAAKKSLYSLLCVEPLALLRRLPIIVIEDVCLIEGYSNIIWLMMAFKDYSITRDDFRLLSNYISCLCCTSRYYYQDKQMELPEITHEKIISWNSPIEDELLGLFYRHQYGGMKGDLDMLRNAIYYYKDNQEIVRIDRIDNEIIEILLTIDSDFINSSIDYHPYPDVINQIYDSLHGVITKDRIKKVIWYTESSNNYRKRYILERSYKEKISEEWSLIKPILKKIRNDIKEQYK